jgi:hypothetical protein
MNKKNIFYLSWWSKHKIIMTIEKWINHNNQGLEYYRAEWALIRKRSVNRTRLVKQP